METPGLASLWFFWIWPEIALCWYDQRQRYNFSWTVCEAVRDSLGDKRDFIKTNLNYMLNWVPLMPVICFDIYSGSLKSIHVRSDLMFLLHVSVDAHSQVFLRKPGVLQFFAPITCQQNMTFESFSPSYTPCCWAVLWGLWLAHTQPWGT